MRVARLKLIAALEFANAASASSNANTDDLSPGADAEPSSAASVAAASRGDGVEGSGSDGGMAEQVDQLQTELSAKEQEYVRRLPGCRVWWRCDVTRVCVCCLPGTNACSPTLLT